MSPLSTENPLPPILDIRKYGDPVLRAKARPIARVDDAVRRLIPVMFNTMYAEPGIGLAAPQVGVSLRLMVVDVAPDGKSRPMALLNPRVESRKGRVASVEGCLSFPGIQVTVPRAEWVRVSALDDRGEPVTVEGDGLLSRCLQHELDHLDGVVMIDRLRLSDRLKVLWEIRRRKKAGLW